MEKYDGLPPLSYLLAADVPIYLLFPNLIASNKRWSEIPQLLAFLSDTFELRILIVIFPGGLWKNLHSGCVESNCKEGQIFKCFLVSCEESQRQIGLAQHTLYHLIGQSNQARTTLLRWEPQVWSCLGKCSLFLVSWFSALCKVESNGWGSWKEIIWSWFCYLISSLSFPLNKIRLVRGILRNIPTVH